MPTPITDFDYHLPPEFIAQTQLIPRDSSRLLVVDRETGEAKDRHFYDIVEELQAGDVLVFNSSKVFKARLLFGEIEILILRIREGEADVLLRPGRKFAVRAALPLEGARVKAKEADGVVTIETGRTVAEMLDYCANYGVIPTPPYMEQGVDEVAYQTIYAKEVGSVAAPTAGLHFTPELIEKLKNKGIQTEYVTLHVGLGTFRPVQVETLEEHTMHGELVSIDEETVKRLVTAKNEGRRVIAVGTTTVRVLEGVAQKFGQLQTYSGEINMFITPGFIFRVIDGLITNFHLPKSTLLVLVSALAGRERVLAAYEQAKKFGYRFFSFGDAMFIS
ncbi:TPA: tRNA preQ1(34) S-adenosylmethionine ribosyltransferase-isomerase QueA [Candidatus Uhrbacteria bacterium]|nr:tRNA preQ1(34) S-adenosylmethionine ribosyltransferase-isomerase QueA [Candidatus Uhrbacteria bacterium]